MNPAILLLPSRTVSTHAQSKRLNHSLPRACFHCHGCGRTMPVGGHGCGTGYGVTRRGKLVCYACCGKRDIAEMKRTGRGFLYFDDRSGTVSNWPGTVKFKAYFIRHSWHNFAGHNGRRDFRFIGPDGAEWCGANIGNNQCAKCRRMKS